MVVSLFANEPSHNPFFAEEPTPQTLLPHVYLEERERQSEKEHSEKRKKWQIWWGI
jgi:hypothetical protein